ncbi:zf-HC2 domain-containing protein [Pleionea sediminis]|uniref:zf-HC2 domain-containing protein n=1 Tax=Pleionea sediminis TaxID=2569479 RepID=UPI0011871E7D|nr:zf-HC2 domain-containing protein [Pleionea sediminis]
MSCDHSLVERYLFEYLESTLEPSLARAFEQSIDRCEHCRDLYHGAVNMQQMDKTWHEQTPPNWHRTAFVARSRQSKHVNWMNRLSLATSTLAIMLVLFRVEFISNDSGFSVSFGGKGSQSEIASIVEQKVSQLAEQQAEYIDTRFENQKLDRVSENQEMVKALLAHNRSERRQDMNVLMASWLQQRDSDQQKFNKRLDYVVDNQIENNQYLNQVLKTSH